MVLRPKCLPVNPGRTRGCCSAPTHGWPTQALYRFVGIEPTEQSILVDESSVHFRADFTPIRRARILVRRGARPDDRRPQQACASTRLAPGLRLQAARTPFCGTLVNTGDSFRSRPCASPLLVRDAIGDDREHVPYHGAVGWPTA